MSPEKNKPQMRKNTAGPVPRAPAPIPPEPLVAEENEDGTIRISENVISAVVRKYTLQVDGVVRFASTSLVGGLAEMIGRRTQDSSIAVQLDGNAVNITVTLVMRFGVNVPDVATAVQDVIRKRVEDLTGKHVTCVDVVVQDLEDVEHVAGEEPEAEE
jgi:uncharacterized alkaline shock family protein YloU